MAIPIQTPISLSHQLHTNLSAQCAAPDPTPPHSAAILLVETL